MKTFATTHLSSDGRIVIPEAIRKQLHLKAGTQFMVVAEDDLVILKVISESATDPFDTLVQQARRQAKRVGLKHSDIPKAISIARKG